MSAETLTTATAVLDTGAVEVTLTGELDMLSAPDLVGALRAVLVDHAPANIDLDMAGVQFMDSTGIQVLMAAHTDAASTGGRLRIVRTSPEVHRVLSLTGLLDTFELSGPQP